MGIDNGPGHMEVGTVRTSIYLQSGSCRLVRTCCTGYLNPEVFVVCVFASRVFWTPTSPGVRISRDHAKGSSHRKSCSTPPYWGACLDLRREKDSVVPRRVVADKQRFQPREPADDVCNYRRIGIGWPWLIFELTMCTPILRMSASYFSNRHWAEGEG